MRLPKKSSQINLKRQKITSKTRYILRGLLTLKILKKMIKMHFFNFQRLVERITNNN
jgi:hypothetical protein